LIDLLLSAKVEIKNFADVAALILRMPELMFHPKAFELPGINQDPLLFYVGHEVDLDRVEEPYDWTQLQADRPLIYCSLGSQLDLRVNASRRFIRTVIDAAARRPNLQFVFSLGSKMDASEFDPLPSNMILSHWTPQLQMLARASVMITHSGMGAVKECILHGVPMLAFPLMRDQFVSADRIVYHGLGLRGDVENMNHMGNA
jgi:zeaxanthin glucosyltransferase